MAYRRLFLTLTDLAWDSTLGLAGQLAAYSSLLSLKPFLCNPLHCVAQLYPECH